ncbi:MAG: von Willebrand factor type A domain-containing protein [Verrucomicrobiota bacterium]
MNDDEKNEGPQPWIDPALEARVVAGVLGETSAFEASELERILAENPELAIFKRRIEAVHALVGAAIRPEAPKIQLSPGRRQRLLKKLGVRPAPPTKKVKEFTQPFRRWLSPQMLNRLVACLVIMAFVAVLFSLSIPAVTGSLQKSSRRSVLASSRISHEQPEFSGESGGFVATEGLARGGAATASLSAPSALVDHRVDYNGQAAMEGVLKSVAPAAGKPMEFAMNAAPRAGVTVNVAPPSSVSMPPMSGPVNMVSTVSSTAQVAARTGGTTAVSSLDKVGPDSAGPSSRPRSSVAQSVDSLPALTMMATLESPVMQQAPEPAATPDSAMVIDAFTADLRQMSQQDRAAGNQEVAEKAKEALPAGPEDVRNSRYIVNGSPIGGTATGNVINQPVFSSRTTPDGKTIQEFDGFINYGCPIVATAAPQATAIKQFSGGWGKGSGSGTGARGEFAKNDEREQSAREAFKEEVAAPEPAKQNEASLSTGWDSLYMFRGVNVISTGLDGTASNSRSEREVAAAVPMEQAEAKASDGEAKQRVLNQPGKPGFVTSSPSAGSVDMRGFPLGTEVRTVAELGLDKKIFGDKSDVAPMLGDVPIAGKPLQEAQNYYASGRYDLAFKRYEQVLSADPYNIAARRGMEQVNNARTKYQETAYNEARGNMVLLVDNSWSSPVRKFAPAATQMQPQIDTHGTDSINRKLDEIIIPKIDFRDVTVREALDFIKQRAASLDTAEQDSALKGVHIVLKPVPDSAEPESKITLSLTDIPLRTAIDYVASVANMKFKVEPYAVVVAPVLEFATELRAKVPQPSTKSATAFQDEIKTAKQPFSTFSLHVSDVSFQLAKDALAKGTMPDPDRIRAEEFYNAFDYNDPSPGPGEEVACRIEQCAHPFVQQRDLVRIALKVAAAGRAAGQPLRLTILLDTSGSMEREDRAASVRRALGTLATLLGPNDRVTLIGFARTPRLLAEQVPGDQANKLVEIAARTPSEGGTNLELALALASEQALKQRLPAAQNRIVLLTDGAANLGNADPARLAREIEKTRQSGISFDACGVGANGLNDEMLEALTRKGDGRYYFLNRPEDADAGFARQLAGALRPAAENVKVQVVFNPARVSQYRLIGFEKHLLKKEDFRNDKVQAAELAAEEAGVALYQVQTLPEGEGELGEVFVRFRDPANGQMVEHSWTIPYDAKAPAFDKAAPSMQLAATAALLAEKLRGDSRVDLNAMAPIITNLRGRYPHQAKVGELIRMFERMRQ